MLMFPNYLKPVIAEVQGNSFKESYLDSTLITTTDANYKITRPRASRQIGTYEYSFRALSEEDYKKLFDFWIAVNGTADMFYFVPYHGVKAGEKIAVRFSKKFEAQQYVEGYRIDLTFEEV